MNMVKQEFKHIFKNKILLISVIAITFIPILYAGFFDKSVWDPYGRAKDLPVAVVNEDVETEMLGQKVDVGKQVVDQLKENKDLKWEFVSKEKADKGMKDLYYYMIIEIPKDFSKNATSLLDRNPKKMNITYTTNGSLNYIGEEISEIGATTLNSQVRDNVTEAYVTALNEVGKKAVQGIGEAASGGMFVPFVNPELAWDFRLKNVVSINTSGHKYGLVYPGVGWILWKDKKYLPEELIFDVSYLGGNMPTMAINFSRSASQIIGQYYNFYRYGFNGYKEIHERTKEAAMTIAKAVEATGLFDMYNDGENIPIVCYKLKDEADVEWTLYDLADRLQMKGWQVPAYPLPKNLDKVVVQRFVCRADLGQNLADALVRDFNQCLDELSKARILYHDKGDIHTHGFTH